MWVFLFRPNWTLTNADYADSKFVCYNRRMRHSGRLVIGIAGGSGSGKTTVAQEILNRVGPDRIAFIQHDSYYKDLSGLPPVQRAEVNFDHPNSLETELIKINLCTLYRRQ